MLKNEQIIETKKCTHCEISFEITNKDLEFYDKISPVFNGKKYSIPTPTLCPDCRQQRRLSFRNERKLYKRKCDATGKDIISIYSPDKPYKVHNQDFWWSDKWDPLDYGRDFDFKRGFFEQFNELLENIPKQNVIGANNQNSTYCNLTADNKNCYLIFESSNNEDCFFGHWLQKCNHCTDCNFMHQCELCYESLDCYDCFNSKYLFSCKNCTDSYFLEDCIGCKNCFGCVNLQDKEFYIFNKSYSKEEYFRKIEEFSINNIFKEKFLKLSKNYPKKYLRILNSINCIGNQIEDSKNCIYCNHAHDAEDCKYGEHVWRNAKKCVDVSTAGRDAEFIFESINCGIGVYNCKYCVQCWSGSNLTYCVFNNNIYDCFGCVGLHNNEQYCILNKQYTKEQYEELVPKIIEHMMKTGEWGEFFPSSMSPFGYNETVAMEYFPISPPLAPPYQGGEQEKVPPLTRGRLGGGFNWSTYEAPFPKVDKIIPANMLPDDISKIPDDILNRAIECEVTKKPFRIIKQELEFYRKHNLPIPRRHPDQRHLDRMVLRNPRKLFDRKCDKCGVLIKTTYNPDRKEIVYCEECYNKEIY